MRAVQIPGRLLPRALTWLKPLVLGRGIGVAMQGMGSPRGSSGDFVGCGLVGCLRVQRVAGGAPLQCWTIRCALRQDTVGMPGMDVVRPTVRKVRNPAFPNDAIRAGLCLTTFVQVDASVRPPSPSLRSLPARRTTASSSLRSDPPAGPGTRSPSALARSNFPDRSEEIRTRGSADAGAPSASSCPVWRPVAAVRVGRDACTGRGGTLLPGLVGGDCRGGLRVPVQPEPRGRCSQLQRETRSSGWAVV